MTSQVENIEDFDFVAALEQLAEDAALELPPTAEEERLLELQKQNGKAPDIKPLTREQWDALKKFLFEMACNEKMTPDMLYVSISGTSSSDADFIQDFLSPRPPSCLEDAR